MRRLRLLLLAALWLAYFVLVSYVFYHGERHDFRAYYTAAEAINAGQSIYQGTEGSIAYLYPPLLAQLFALVTRFASEDMTALIWQALNIGLLVVTLHYLSRYFAEKKQQRVAYLVWVLPLFFTPFMQSYWVGQVSVLLLACLTGAWLLIKRERRIWSGALLAFAAWIKVFPAFLLLYFLWRRDWRVVKGAAIAAILLLGVQLVLSNPNDTVSFFTELLPELTFAGKENPEQGLFKNSSLLGFSQKLFIETVDNAALINNPDYVRPVRYGLLLIIMGGSIALIVRNRRYDVQTQRFDDEYALTLIVALLFGSVLWISSLPPLFLAYILLLKQKRYQWLGWLSFAFLAWYFPMLMSRGDGVQWAWWVMSLGFFAILLLWGAFILRLRRVAP